MDTILGSIIEEISGKYQFECKRIEGYLFIDAPDRSIGVKYIDDNTVEILVEYIGDTGTKTVVTIKNAPTTILKLLKEKRSKTQISNPVSVVKIQKPWWKFW